MADRQEIIGAFYGRADEDGRLKRSLHGRLEYATTMAYIHRFADSRSRVLEVGAGTGRYSVALAKEAAASIRPTASGDILARIREWENSVSI